jgi:LmbE family N-acetylglucosaminyl deacetylase
MAHPDDEVLACGGTLAKHADAGDNVYVRILSSRSREFSTQASEAFLALGLAHDSDPHHLPFVCGGLPDQQFDTVPFVDIRIDNTDPDIVYTHSPDDLNLDHALVARAVLTAFRPNHSHAAILACETLSSTEWGVEAFQPNHWEEITFQQLDRKIRALDCYHTEVRDRPHPRNAEGLMVAAKYRGQQVCVEYAEAFRLLRSIG